MPLKMTAYVCSRRTLLFTCANISRCQSDESSSEDSDSESESDSSDSEDEATLQKAANTKLPDSGSSSDADDVKKEPSPAVKHESDSSVTMGKTSPEVFPVSTFAPLPPDPKKNNRGKGATEDAKKPNVPFSRIDRNIKVEDKFKSNRFTDNAHGWGQKAHEDLIVTKGKGFTKEKNKKKRGSYRGGFIDTGARNGIKFDD